MSPATAGIEGLLNIDKPGGLTSHDVVNQVRRLAGTRRVGHAGTLDPLATGVLLVCLGRATRLVEYLVGQAKTYETVIRLGQTTTTYDAEGEKVADRPVHLSDEALATVLDQFRGPIRQQPPLYSAVKKAGQPLYKLARQGVDVERPWREVTIYELALLEWHSPWLHLRITCSAGAYIRSLAHDLGQALGCGGYVAALRRTAVGAFTVADAVPLAELTVDWRQHLQATEQAVAHLPRLDLTAEAARRLQQGQPIPRQPYQPEGTPIRAYDEDGRFIGVVRRQNDEWQAHKILLL